MSVSLNLDGQQRVVIEHVTPEIDGGRFSIKAIPNDVIAVEANIFADRYEYPAARLLYKHADDTNWSEMAMAQLFNDRWGASFIVEKQGRYVYTIEAWIDYPTTWQQQIQEKVANEQRIDQELVIGNRYVDRMLKQAGQQNETPDLNALQEIATVFRDENRYDEAVSIAISDQFTFFANRYPERNHITRYVRELTVDVERARAAFSTWYGMFPRSASQQEGQHGTFREVETLLPRIADMGFDVLYFQPIHPIGTTNRRGKNNSTISQANDPGVPNAVGLAMGGHDTLHPQLGTVDEFKHLIAIAANYGLEVAMDLAIQCSPDHPWVTQHPNWFKKQPDGTFQHVENPPRIDQDSYSINFETDDWQNLWNALKDVVLLWASWGIRIIRADNPHTKPFIFWEWLIAEVKKVYPDMLFLAEAFTRPNVMQELNKRGFSQSYTYFIWRNSKYELEQYVTELTQSEMKYYLRPNFWPTTPDINPSVFHEGHEPQFLIRYFLAATLSSNCGIYGPVFELMQHEAVPNKEEFLDSEKFEIRNWDWNKTNRLTYLISLVNRLRSENVALQTTNNLTFCYVSDDSIMAYLKISGTNRLLIVVNTDAYNRRASIVHVPIWQLGIGHEQRYTVTDLLTGAYYNWTGSQNYVELDPYSLPMHLFKIEV